MFRTILEVQGDEKFHSAPISCLILSSFLSLSCLYGTGSSLGSIICLCSSACHYITESHFSPAQSHIFNFLSSVALISPVRQFWGKQSGPHNDFQFYHSLSVKQSLFYTTNVRYDITSVPFQRYILLNFPMKGVTLH